MSCTEYSVETIGDLLEPGVILSRFPSCHQMNRLTVVPNPAAILYDGRVPCQEAVCKNGALAEGNEVEFSRRRSATGRHDMNDGGLGWKTGIRSGEWHQRDRGHFVGLCN